MLHSIYNYVDATDSRSVISASLMLSLTANRPNLLAAAATIGDTIAVDINFAVCGNSIGDKT